MIFYHRTNASEVILREGFRDRNGLVGAFHAGIEGVFLADRPLDCQEGAKGDELLEINLPDELDISDYELIEDEKPYREWCVPAAVIKEHGQVRLMTRDEEYELPEFPLISDLPPDEYQLT